MHGKNPVKNHHEDKMYEWTLDIIDDFLYLLFKTIINYYLL